MSQPRRSAPIVCSHEAIESMEPRLLLSSAPLLHAPAHRPSTTPTVRVSKIIKHLPAPKPAKHPAKSPKPSAKTIAAQPSTSGIKSAAPGAIITAGPFANPFINNQSVFTPGVAPFMPSEIRHFYGLDTLTFGGIVGDGTGQTIAIIDAYSQPNLLPTTDPHYASFAFHSDLYQFDQQFGLPDPPSFTKINESGGSTLPTGYDSGWAIEQSLDVEWAHVMAPNASIVLVEATSPTDVDLLQTAVTTAKNLPGVVVVSMSWGEDEFAGETADDSFFTTPNGHPGVTFLASVGDSGAAHTSYPGFSPNVVAVGGTQITTANTNSDYGTETTWNDNYGATGGGISTIEPKPAYQSNITLSPNHRMVPDVSLDAAVSTGVYVLDTSQPGGGGYYQVGGTSLSAPSWAGLIAIADQGRALQGLSSLDGPTQTLPRLYQLATSDFHDVLFGQNAFNSAFGNSAGPGYDLTTGIGTPITNLLVPDLAGGATISGQLFQDNNANANFDGNDIALVGKTVYLDMNNLGFQTPTDPTAITTAGGMFTFNDVLGGFGTVRLASIPTGYIQVGASPFATSFGSTATATLAFFPTAFTDSTNNITYTLRVSPTLSSEVQILINNTLTYFAPISFVPSFNFGFTGTNDKFNIDYANGNPVPTGGVNFNGTASGNGDTLTILGTNGNDTIAANSGAIVFGPNPITFANVANLMIDPRKGSDNLAVNSGSVTSPAQTAHAGILVRTFSSLSIAASASVLVPNTGLHTDRTLLIASNLSINPTGKLDLGQSDMIIRTATTPDLTTAVNLLTTGFASGAWTGNGITSAAAHADPRFLTALGYLQNNFGGSFSSFPIYTSFDGQSAQASDILIKYTYYGDSDLSGKIDGTDYSQTDFGSTGQTGWVNGDFNYSGHVDGSDYTLLDNAFNFQGGQL